MSVSYLGHSIRISADDVARVSQRTRRALVDARKLMLVLDLDHTLLNSKAEARLEDEVRSRVGGRSWRPGVGGCCARLQPRVVRARAKS